MNHLVPGQGWNSNTARKRHKDWTRGWTAEAKEAAAAGVQIPTLPAIVLETMNGDTGPTTEPPVLPEMNSSTKEAETPKEPDVGHDALIRKLEMKAAYYKKGYEDLLKQRAIGDLIVEAIQEAVAAVDPVTPAQISGPTIILRNRPRVLMPVLSDMHIAEKVDGAKIKGFNHHNFAVLDEKLEMWCSEIEEQFQYQCTMGPVLEIQIPVLGDMVTGEDIYRNQKSHIEASVMHQIFIGSDKLAGALLRLAKLGVRITLIMVFGNHGRMGPKGESDFSNDIMMYKYLEAKLSSQPNITFKIDWAFWQTSKLWEWRFYFCHGDNIKGWSGFPWYGQARADANTLMLMLTQGMWYHYFIHGHFHTDVSLQTPIGRRLANGNWLGTTEYGINGGFTGRPSQKLLIVTEENGIETEIPIYLDRIDPNFMKKALEMHA